MTSDWLDTLSRLRLIPVVVIERAEDAWSLAQALKAGGLACAEVTLRTAAATAAIHEIARDTDILLGAGTVLLPSQVDDAIDAGASFIVTPGFSPAVVHRCAERGVPVLPGVATPTEIQLALESGIDVVKFFPAAAMGGVATLRALSAPYAAIRFVPTGGVTAATARQYLALESVIAVGGSWMVSADLIATRRFDEVQRLTAEAVSLVAEQGEA